MSLCSMGSTPIAPVTAIFSLTRSDIYLMHVHSVCCIGPPLFHMQFMVLLSSVQTYCWIPMVASKHMDKFCFMEFLLELQAEGAEEMLKQHVSLRSIFIE